MALQRRADRLPDFPDRAQTDTIPLSLPDISQYRSPGWNVTHLMARPSRWSQVSNSSLPSSCKVQILMPSEPLVAMVLPSSWNAAPHTQPACRSRVRLTHGRDVSSRS